MCRTLSKVLLTILLLWSVCGILTATDVFPEGDGGRTDLKLDLLHNSAWVRVPYPCESATFHLLCCLQSH